MRIARVAVGDAVLHARADGDATAVGAWVPIEDPYLALGEGRLPADIGAPVPSAEARLLAPAAPTVLVGIAQNRGSTDRPLPVQAWLRARAPSSRTASPCASGATRAGSSSRPRSRS
ncbi:DUF2437 domain-containing protein [Agrococcus sp. Marseille-Q4369]|uniref:DUF2437 domain-containing protein n=1 Tax=Agrococcus sp. Marseille-Q4369 TaxID=2810513 RepID=UPI0020165EB5|nr:DUF2437 domain-containing protein [Agrococcus sp. Marseille-Q4369]